MSLTKQADSAVPFEDANQESAASVDAVLVERVQNGDVAAFDELVRKYRERLYGIIYNLTSNREVYDMHQMTAAHKTLPLPTYVRVRNLSNDRTIIVRVNDRGPFHPDRLIDVSYGAAVQLGFAEQGTAVVKVESIDLEGIDDRRELASTAYRYLQLGAYASELAARQLGEEISERWDYPVTVTAVDTEGERLYRVRLGPFSGADELESARAELIAAGYLSPQRLP